LHRGAGGELFSGEVVSEATEAREKEAFLESDEESDRREPSIDGARAYMNEGTNLMADGGRRGAFEANASEDPGDGGGVIGSAREDTARHHHYNDPAGQTPEAAALHGEEAGGTARLEGSANLTLPQSMAVDTERPADGTTGRVAAGAARRTNLVARGQTLVPGLDFDVSLEDPAGAPVNCFHWVPEHDEGI
jgi:hypothetical protein